MLGAVVEFTQQQVAESMAQRAKEYAAAAGQWDSELSAVNRVKLEYQMAQLDKEMQDLAARSRQPWPDYLPQIDYTRAIKTFERVMTHLQPQGGAALLMLQNSRTLGGRWCVERLRSTLHTQTTHFRRLPVAIMLGDRLDAPTFLTRLGSHLGCPPPTDNSEVVLRQAVNALFQTLCDSLQSGSVYFIELKLTQANSLCESFLPWLLNQFWVPLVAERWPQVLQKNPLAMIVLVIEIEQQVQPPHGLEALACTPKAFDSTRILELPLQRWTQQEIEAWLLRFSGLTSPPSNKTPDEVRHLAAQIYSVSKKGTPAEVYGRFLDELPHDERVSLGGSS
jgi:hypothetical protein